MGKKRKLIVMVLMVLAGSSIIHSTLLPSSGAEKSYNIIHFSQSVSKMIENDTLQVIFSIESKHKDRQRAMNEGVKRLNTVMKEIKTNPIFEAQLLDRSVGEATRNIDNQRNSKGDLVYTKLWEDRSRVLVKSKNFEAMNSLLAKLQPVANIENMSFTNSKESIKSLEDELTKEAIQKFDQKAKLVTRELGGRNYRLVSLNLGNVDRPPYFEDYNLQLMGAANVQSAPAAQLEDSLPGQRTINLNVTGSIEVLR